MNTSSYLKKKKESKMFKPTEKNQMRIFVAFLILCIIIIFVALAIGCSTKEAGVNVKLHDIWALESINSKQFVKDEHRGNHPVIEIYLKEERLQGNAGCNTINGKIKVDANNISFSNIITTEMACPGDLEVRFLAALQSVDNYKIEKLRLYLYEGKDERLVFRKID
jgi:heat shock protein HslJ